MTTPRDDVVVVGAGLAGLTVRAPAGAPGAVGPGAGARRCHRWPDPHRRAVRLPVRPGVPAAQPGLSRGPGADRPAGAGAAPLLRRRRAAWSGRDPGRGRPRPGTPAARAHARQRLRAPGRAGAAGGVGRHRPSAASSGCWPARTPAWPSPWTGPASPAPSAATSGTPSSPASWPSRSGSTSAQFARLLVRSFVLGRPGVPAAGMAALPGQISAALTSPVHLSTEVTEIRRTRSGVSVGSSAGSFAARAVVVAADPVTAGRLAGTPVPRMKGLATWWYAAAEAPSDPAAAVPGLAHLRLARWSTARS